MYLNPFGQLWISPLYGSYLVCLKNYTSDALLDVEAYQNSQIMHYLVEVTVTEVLENKQFL